MSVFLINLFTKSEVVEAWGCTWAGAWGALYRGLGEQGTSTWNGAR